MTASVKIAKILLTKKKYEKHSKKLNFDGGLLNLGISKKEKKKS